MKSVPVWVERDSVQEAEDNLVVDMKRGVIQAIQEALVSEIKEFEDATFGYVEQQLIANAEGSVLDSLAALYQVFRSVSETDEQLRVKVRIEFLRKSLSTSREDVETGLRSALGTDDFTIINRTGNSVWVMAGLECYSPDQDFAKIAELFPINHDLKISVYDRAYAGGQVNPNTKPFGSFFVPDNSGENGSITALVYNRRETLYGN